MIKPTPRLKALLDDYEKILNNDEFLSLSLEVNFRIEEMMRQIESLKSGQDRAAFVQNIISAETENIRHLKLSCKQGCSFCCYLPVQITRDEANILVDAICAGVKIDESRLKNFEGRLSSSPEWARGPVDENRCLFLSERGHCQVYDHRPSACRKLLVTSSPENCGVIGSEVRLVEIPNAEIALSAYISLPFVEYGLMASLIGRVLNERLKFASRENKTLEN